eukprot:tig00001542_g9311.t1
MAATFVSRRLHILYRDVDKPENGPSAPSLTGVFFTFCGVTAVALAVAFMIAEFVIANYYVTQSLNPGVSPSAGAIAGDLAVSVAFRGYKGPCARPGDVLVEALGFSGAWSATSRQPADGYTCSVTWTCKACRRARAARRSRALRVQTQSPSRRLASVQTQSPQVDVVLRPPWNVSSAGGAPASSLAASRTLAFSVGTHRRAAHAVTQLPGGVSVTGATGTTSRSRLFRGERPVTVPLSLNAVHFSRDESLARYKASVPNEDNAEAEIGAANFRPDLPAQNAVGFRVVMNVAPSYLLVDEKTKSSVLDFLSGVYALGLGAFRAVAEAFAVYVALARLLSSWRARREGGGGPGGGRQRSEKTHPEAGPGALSPAASTAEDLASASVGPDPDWATLEKQQSSSAVAQPPADNGVSRSFGSGQRAQQPAPALASTSALPSTGSKPAFARTAGAGGDVDAKPSSKQAVAAVNAPSAGLTYNVSPALGSLAPVAPPPPAASGSGSSDGNLEIRIGNVLARPKLDGPPPSAFGSSQPSGFLPSRGPGSFLRGGRTLPSLPAAPASSSGPFRPDGSVVLEVRLSARPLRA